MSQATYSYIKGYYLHVQRQARAYPETAGFWRAELAGLEAERVLNLGCGPTFYDYAAHLGRPPREYVGLDVNQAVHRFLRRSALPPLVAARRRVADAGILTRLILGDARRDVVFHQNYDGILAAGFFGLFAGDDLARVFALARDALEPGGLLVKVTWHGQRLAAAEAIRKRAWGFGPPASGEPAPAELIAAASAAGLVLERDVQRDVEPGYGHGFIQVCRFRAA